MGDGGLGSVCWGCWTVLPVVVVPGIRSFADAPSHNHNNANKHHDIYIHMHMMYTFRTSSWPAPCSTARGPSGWRAASTTTSRPYSGALIVCICVGDSQAV